MRASGEPALGFAADRTPGHFLHESQAVFFRQCRTRVLGGNQIDRISGILSVTTEVTLPEDDREIVVQLYGGKGGWIRNHFRIAILISLTQ